jgi:hypothetical protein
MREKSDYKLLVEEGFICDRTPTNCAMMKM